MKYVKWTLITISLLTIFILLSHYAHSSYYKKEIKPNNTIDIEGTCSCYGQAIFERHVAFGNSYTADVTCQGIEICSTINRTVPASNATRDVTVLQANISE